MNRTELDKNQTEQGTKANSCQVVKHDEKDKFLMKSNYKEQFRKGFTPPPTPPRVTSARTWTE